MISTESAESSQDYLAQEALCGLLMFGKGIFLKELTADCVRTGPIRRSRSEPSAERSSCFERAPHCFAVVREALTADY